MPFMLSWETEGTAMPRCTGAIDTDGLLSHDGPTCPVHEDNRLDWRERLVVGHALRDRIAMMTEELNRTSETDRTYETHAGYGSIDWVPAHWVGRLWEIDRVIRDLGIEGDTLS